MNPIRNQEAILGETLLKKLEQKWGVMEAAKAGVEKERVVVQKNAAIADESGVCATYPEGRDRPSSNPQSEEGRTDFSQGLQKPADARSPAVVGRLSADRVPDGLERRSASFGAAITKRESITSQWCPPRCGQITI
jgi:hypothetical protein